MSNDSRKNRLIALIGTIALHVIVVVVLCVSYVKYTASETRQWPPVDSSEILYGGELVRLGSNYVPMANNKSTPAPSEAETSAKSGEDIQDEGTQGEPEPLVTSVGESPAKEKEKAKPEKTGPTKEELAERERVKREKEAAERIKNQVKFGNNGNGAGNAGSPDGNSTVGATSGTPGHTLKGRTLESFGRPKSQLSGTIRIKVRVNRQGYVIGSPQYVGGEGPASANLTIRNRCISASQESRFSVSEDAQAEQVGVITWRFE